MRNRRRFCAACGRRLSPNPYPVSEDGDAWTYVGVECWRKIRSAGPAGYVPPNGTVRLFPLRPEHLARIVNGWRDSTVD